MRNSIFVGIDPGKAGAMAVHDEFYDCTSVFDFKDYEFYEIGDLLLTATGGKNPVKILFEMPGSRPGNSKTNDLTSFMNAGVIVGSLKANGFKNITFIQPASWQKPLNLKHKSSGSSKQQRMHKEEIANHAAKHYPDVNFFGPKGGLRDGRTDALMIMHHLRTES